MINTKEDFKDDAFKTLCWCKDNPMKMVECKGEGNLIIFRYNDLEDVYEYKINYHDTMWSIFDFSFENTLKFKNIREYREPESKEKIWSEDGIALREPKTRGEDGWRCEGGDLEEAYESLPHHYEKGNYFKTKERAELERDRREVDYFMKKCACKSREDNDWRTSGKFGYIIRYFFNKDFEDAPTFRVISKYEVSFNDVCFYDSHDANYCLDKLIEKYGEEKLKNIWGIK